MKVLVIGDGLLGFEIVKQTNWDYISRKKDGIDFTNLETYQHMLYKYDTILNCVAFTQTYSDDKNINRETNYVAVSELSDFCSQQNKKLIHISTDYVYTYSVNNATENDIPLISKNWYTYYKLLADEYIQLKNNNFLICRCSFKPKPYPYENGWVDHVGNFDYVDEISKIIIKLIEKNAQGLFNVGTDIKNVFQLSKETNPMVNVSLKPKEVPSNVTMDIKKLKKFLNE